MSDVKVSVWEWDNCCPHGIPYSEYLKDLAVIMVQCYFSAGGKGILLVHPMTVSMFVTTSPMFMGQEFKWDGPLTETTFMGRIGGVPVHASMAVPKSEVFVVDGPEEIDPISKIVIKNFVDVESPLDRMAQI
ncbi:MAG: hypothetical protein AB7L09_00020 [Nitrospira sp.]